ncbi:MAG: hypothetical protein QOJ64_248 [Acidobacteriota bacterium]|jgi:hypothetical protein|nr:hypothetical protein [Acidobacteriota bacterium]
MKSCPTCNRTFEDTFTFCLVDGSILSAPFDPQATKQGPNVRDTSPPPTQVMPPQNFPYSKDALPPTMRSPHAGYTPPFINNAGPYSPPPQFAQQQYRGEPTHKTKGGRLRVIAIVLTALCVLYITSGGYSFKLLALVGFLIGVVLLVISLLTAGRRP